MGFRIHRHVTCITSGAQSLPYSCLVAARLARQMFRSEWDLAKNGVMEPRVSMAVKERRGKATMKLSMDQDLVTLNTLAEVIARSQIVLESSAGRVALLPPGFDATDVAVLDWIVAEGRSVARSYAFS